MQGWNRLAKEFDKAENFVNLKSSGIYYRDSVYTVANIPITLGGYGVYFYPIFEK
jgi:hypothetical protein